MAVSNYGQRNGLSRFKATEHTGQGCDGIYRVAAKVNNDVAHLYARFFRCQATHNIRHICAGRYTIALCIGTDIAHIHAHIGTLNITKFLQVGNNACYIIDGNGEAKAFDAGAGAAVAGILGGDNTDHLAVHIKERSTGVAGIDSRIGLQHRNGVAFGIHNTVLCAHITDGHREGQFAQGVTDGHHLVADLQVVAAAISDCRQILCLDL